MYHEHWGLSGSPFQDSVNQSRLLASPPHAEAIARLKFLVENRHRLGVLSGPSGAGKSQLLCCFAASARRQGACVVKVCLSGLERERFLWKVAAGLGTNPGRCETVVTMWRKIEDQLASLRYQQTKMILLFDDAFAIDPSLHGDIIRLVGYDTTAEIQMTTILAGLSGRLSMLPTALVELIDLRIELEPWEEDHLATYLDDEMQQVGGSPQTFDADAVAELYRLSGGVPRRVNQLAELCLVAAAGTHSATIDAGIVSSVFEELGAGALVAS